MALSAATGENPGGWVAGAADYLTPEGAHDRTLLAWHKEQILTLPTAAQVVSGSSACPYAVLRYGDAALTYQAHPEFTADFIRGLVATRGQSLPDGIKSGANNADDSEIARARSSVEIVTFLKSR
ncbi:hypothetical protein U8Q05_30805 (plasmid) [Rhizobium ruizarguesonis]|nr:hypothetical protein U8Q05_30805 [Rhizobium ruizarguesonis]